MHSSPPCARAEWRRCRAAAPSPRGDERSRWRPRGAPRGAARLAGRLDDAELEDRVAPETAGVRRVAERRALHRAPRDGPIEVGLGRECGRRPRARRRARRPSSASSARSPTGCSTRSPRFSNADGRHAPGAGAGASAAATRSCSCSSCVPWSPSGRKRSRSPRRPRARARRAARRSARTARRRPRAGELFDQAAVRRYLKSAARGYARVLARARAEPRRRSRSSPRTLRGGTTVVHSDSAITRNEAASGNCKLARDPRGGRARTSRMPPSGSETAAPQARSLTMTAASARQTSRTLGAQAAATIPPPEPTARLQATRPSGLPDAASVDVGIIRALHHARPRLFRPWRTRATSYKDLNPVWAGERLQLKLAPGGERPPKLRIEVWSWQGPEDAATSMMALVRDRARHARRQRRTL